jgi:hypothetical protein
VHRITAGGLQDILRRCTSGAGHTLPLAQAAGLTSAGRGYGLVGRAAGFTSAGPGYGLLASPGTCPRRIARGHGAELSGAGAAGLGTAREAVTRVTALPRVKRMPAA